MEFASCLALLLVPMMRPKIVSSLQKTYDECYLTCSTAVFFEGKVCLFFFFFYFFLSSTFVALLLTLLWTSMSLTV